MLIGQNVAKLPLWAGRGSVREFATSALQMCLQGRDRATGSVTIT